jgi:hypothetical protein
VPTLRQSRRSQIPPTCGAYVIEKQGKIPVCNVCDVMYDTCHYGDWRFGTHCVRNRTVVEATALLDPAVRAYIAQGLVHRESGRVRAVTTAAGSVWRDNIEQGWNEVTMNSSRLGLVEIVAEDCVRELGLRNPELVGGTLDQFFVLVGDDEWLVLRRERPRAHVAVQRATLTRIALANIALLAEGLPVSKVVRPAPQPRDFVVGTELYIWLLPSAGRAFVVVLFFELLPVASLQFRSWLALLAYIQALQLVLGAFLSDRREALFTLQLAQPPEHILVWRLTQRSFESVDSSANLLLSEDGAGDPVARRPECGQEDGVDGLVCLARLHEPSSCVRQPFLSPGFGFVRSRPRCDKKAFAGSGFGHLGDCPK